MVDLDLVLKKLAFIETCVHDLRTKANIAALASDVREERFVIHTLQLAIQAALDSASHIVSDYRLGEPNTNRELFDLLTKDQAEYADEGILGDDPIRKRKMSCQKI